MEYAGQSEFDGLPAKAFRAEGVIDVFYGGALAPDGPGCGHFKAHDRFRGDVIYWRLPACKGGRTIVDYQDSQSVSE